MRNVNFYLILTVVACSIVFARSPYRLKIRCETAPYYLSIILGDDLYDFDAKVWFDVGENCIAGLCEANEEPADVSQTSAKETFNSAKLFDLDRSGDLLWPFGYGTTHVDIETLSESNM